MTQQSLSARRTNGFRWCCAVLMVASLISLGWATRAEDQAAALQDLGEALFFDTEFSANRTQACATCHAPELAFTDPRETPAAGRAVSLGDDGISTGDRNAPTLTYARFTPAFHRNDEGEFVGGQFLDGRAGDLEEQAAEPPLNPREMAMPGKAAVVDRIRANPDYVGRFESVFGPDVFGDVDIAYAAFARAIAAFERGPQFATFDSRYDRYLRGEYELTDQEELGRLLFFSRQFSNCGLCHRLQPAPGYAEETFSNYEFHNIGVPTNPTIPGPNGTGFVDHGLMQNPAANESRHDGKFRTPGLRNVAVTGPYMHNGVFADLETVVRFYNKYNSRSARNQINPETGKPWAAPEVAANLSLEELEHGPALDDRRVAALVAFLRTLTDARFEPLLPPPPQ
jgi:cytochrome c peroxidase